jgi:hypothetical protein
VRDQTGGRIADAKRVLRAGLDRRGFRRSVTGPPVFPELAAPHAIVHGPNRRGVDGLGINDRAGLHFGNAALRGFRLCALGMGLHAVFGGGRVPVAEDRPPLSIAGESTGATAPAVAREHSQGY